MTSTFSLSLSQTTATEFYFKPEKSIPNHTFYIHVFSLSANFILQSHLYLYLASTLFLSDIPTRYFYPFLLGPTLLHDQSILSFLILSPQ